MTDMFEIIHVLKF